eukprot:SAG31_NODE_34_length_31842_cov_31.677850_1_plen_239_part_00
MKACLQIYNRLWFRLPDLKLPCAGAKLHTRSTRCRTLASCSITTDVVGEAEETVASRATPKRAVETARVLKQAYRLSALMTSDTASIRWSRAALRDQNRPQEGHSACLLDERWMIVVGGFGGGIINDVTVLDTFRLPHNPMWVRAEMTGRQPRAKYGHTSTALPDGKTVAVLGGVRYGGYQGDVGDYHMLHFDFEEDAEDSRHLVVHARWEQPQINGATFRSQASPGHNFCTAIKPSI